MRYLLIVVFAVFPIYCSAFDTSDLKTDLISTNENNWVYEQYMICKFGKRSRQATVHVEAPKDAFISRDKFVALATLIDARFAAALKEKIEKKSWSKPECESIDTLDGKADIVSSATLSEQGLQVTVTDSDGKVRESRTTRWADFGK